MKILDIVTPAAVLDDLRAETKEGVLRELSEVISGMVPSLPADRLTSILMERESLGSTGIGDGVAIPHGKVAGIERLVAAFGRSRKGVQFHSLDGKPAHLFFVIMAPEYSAGMHLKALARISRLLKDERFRRSLLEAADADGLRRIFQEEDGRG
ncbi:MAG TPA: PTS fructose transporter subunit IIA [Deltaproteobacteria bacterium]|nr:MAG: PTS fructose transporter subunit IIA [Deltaproteobacteria bacterium GWC2_65_14]HBO69388.1 PTS fructose transporter subunit IIA [Deltaproteobacteria bacterium]